MASLRSASLLLRRWRQFLANRGPLATAKAVYRSAVRRIHTSSGELETASELWRNADSAPAIVHPFDVKYGTETSGLIWGENLPTGHPHDAWNTAYYGIAPSAFEEALHLLVQRNALDLSNFTFIDLGSGKGRAVLLAAMHPFARVIGVELSEPLHAISIANLASFPADARPCPSVELLHADAADFPWTHKLGPQGLMNGHLLFFLYNPFSRPVLAVLLKKLSAYVKNGNDVFFLCVNPELDSVFLSTAWIEKLWHETITIGEADQQADRFGSTTESIAAYRSKHS